MALDIYSLIIYPIIFILPAWIANGTPVIFGGVGVPLDFNKKLGGKPIFGRHKTLRGTASGILGGLIMTAIMYVFISYPPALGAALTIGAIAGDLAGSFIKRRLGIKEGRSVPIMDQYSFFVFALLFALPYLGSFPGYIGLLFITILTGVLHKLTNVLAHMARVKKVPW